MLVLESKFTPEQLTQRWDEKTSPARFAGNDALMDNIFIASRKEDRVFLIRRASGALDPFATVFRGRIVPCGGGSAIKGHFTKRLFDYVLLLVLAFLDGFVYYRAMEEGSVSPSVTGFCIAFVVLLLLIAVPLRKPRRRYREFLEEIASHDR
ncbi:MAG: hypothetical protein J1E00_01465 [Oscillospiraceae bacterium]|nr:hypothetical protein [Oscillospiraceae bacterium]